jgi:hypothetical protein
MAATVSALYYLPRFLIDNRWEKSTGECTLFVRQFDLAEGAKGLSIRIRSDVLTFPDEDEMVAAIAQHHMVELPAEAEGNRMFLPEELRDHGVRVSRSNGRIALPEED